MPKICYEPHRFNRGTLAVIETANEILEDYAKQGITLTLRALYYRFVALGHLQNTDENYARLKSITSKARLAGKIDWSHLQDRTRNLQTRQRFESGKDALNKLAEWYHIDMWENQSYRPEVWIEKDAAVSNIETVCEEWDVPYFSCRGYTSLSEMWRTSIRLNNYAEQGYTPYIIHLGDHDPSGIDMSRNIHERLSETFMTDFEFKRIALNMDQIEKLKPPPNPAKISDTRYKSYTKKFGTKSWELDALVPTHFRILIEGVVQVLIDNKQQWEKDAKEKSRVRKN